MDYLKDFYDTEGPLDIPMKDTQAQNLETILKELPQDDLIAPGRFYFVLRNPTPLVAPIPLRGFQGLFDVPDLLFELRHSISQKSA